MGYRWGAEDSSPLVAVSGGGRRLRCGRTSSGHKAIAAAVVPNWGLAALSLLVAASVQPFRALGVVDHTPGSDRFPGLYCSSSVGSLLDTLLPGRLGEASKAAGFG